MARLELERLRRDAEKSADQRERNRAAVEEKERAARARAKRRWKRERQELEKLEGQAATIGEEHAADSRANSPASKSATAANAPPWRRLEQQFRETTNRRNAIAPEISRLGEQRARLLADNIELDQKAVVTGRADHRARSAGQRNGHAGRRHARSLRAGEEELKGLRAAVQETQEKRSQIEVDLVRKQAELKYLDETSRKELGCPVEELADADEPVPDADAIAEAEQSGQRSPRPHRSARRGQRRGDGRVSRRRSSATTS